MKTLVIIPCYNEAENIEFVVQRIQSVAPTVDYIIVNDCSTDNTKEICIKNNYPFILLPVNLGIGGCMQTGYKYAFEQGYEIAIQHDGDGQHDPSYFSAVIEPIEAGDADVVIGSRFIHCNGFQSSRFRRAGISFLSGLIKSMTRVRILDVTSGYRAINRKYIKLFANQYAQDYPEPEAIMEAALHGAKIMEIPVVMQERNYGESSINSWKPIYYMLKVSVAIILYRFIYVRKDL